MIKAIIFDIGGVIVNTDSFVNKWSRIFKPKNKREFWQDLNQEMLPLCRGDITEKQFWKNVAEKYKVDSKLVPSSLLREDFKKSLKINRQLLKTIKNLKSKYKIAVISNIIKHHSDENRKIGLYDHFDHIVLSFEVKMTKDSKKIFLLALEKLKAKPNECIFVDDVKKFIDTAKSVGMKTILFRNNRQFHSDLKRLLNN